MRSVSRQELCDVYWFWVCVGHKLESFVARQRSGLVEINLTNALTESCRRSEIETI
jgi:hypothetical protein